MVVSTKWALAMGASMALAACSAFSARSDPPRDAGAPEAGSPPSEASTTEGGAPPPPPAAAAASVYRTAVLADQPIAYWRMGEQSGSTIRNEVGGQNALILQGSAKLGAGGALSNDNDTAIRFDGTTVGYAVATDPRPFDFPNAAPFTIEWWANHESVVGAASFEHMIGAAEGKTPLTGNGYFAYWSGDLQVQVEFAEPAKDVTLSTNPPPSGWSYYVLVFDGTNVKLFLDAKEVERRKS